MADFTDLSLDNLALHGHPNNPKDHDVGAIIASIRAFGFIEPVIVNRTTNHILSGHGRVEALVKMRAGGEDSPLGIVAVDSTWLVPVHYVDVPAKQEMAAIIAVNKTVENGGWDEAKLGLALVSVYQDAGLDSLLATGFAEADLSELAKPESTFQPKTVCPHCGGVF